ncbi:MAG TPA: SDR family oxidoreductase [Amycolatopsis sp.]|nr:SDR family oxidoreductase [Amycolatopsis sp.]
MRYLITGAAGGIGRAVAALAATGAEPASLLLVDRDKAALDRAVAALRAQGATAVAFAADLADPSAPEAAVDAAVAEFGGLDTVVSNAGVLLGGALQDLDMAAYDTTFAVNTRATWLLGKAAFAELRRSRGSIVATASVSATHPTPPAGMYSPSKAALLMLVRQMALEWGRYGIRANCVSPGPTDTPLTDASFGPGATGEAARNRAYRESLIPLRRIGRPEDVAAAVIFLAGAAAAQITGVDLKVDGGLSLALMPVTGRAPGFRLDEIATEEVSQ